jgi:hypothetical protein
LDESLMDGVHQRLDRLEALIESFMVSEAIEDQAEEQFMGVVSDKVDAVLAEAAEQRTVTESLVTVWNGQREVLEQVRADLAEAIANGATDEDLAGLDEAIATFDQNTARVQEVVTQGTAAEGETPVDGGTGTSEQPVEGGPVVDPATGLPVDPTTGQPVEPGTGV